MAKLGLAITESIITEYGRSEILRRLSDPFWFQSMGAVMGMDWHSSGITTSVMGALKRVINPRSHDLGIYICGGKGKFSRRTPSELIAFGDRTGINADSLVRASKLSAKIDNTAVQDGFQLYLHNFIVSNEGEWTVVQQGMHENSSTARRYHWHSDSLRSFIEEPHTGVTGINQGHILNMVAKEALPSQKGIMNIAADDPAKMLQEIQLILPHHHEIKAKDIDIKRLGAILWLAHDNQPKDFEELLLLQGLGPRTLQSLALVSEVIHGTPSRFSDPARFSFAHGGKDGHPFPVPTRVYDETINTLQVAVEKAKLGQSEKQEAIKALSAIAKRAEKDFIPQDNVEALIEKERKESWKYGGKTVMGDSKRPSGTEPNEEIKNRQLRLFQ
jgi:hypothetical protein